MQFVIDGKILLPRVQKIFAQHTKKRWGKLVIETKPLKNFSAQVTGDFKNFQSCQNFIVKNPNDFVSNLEVKLRLKFIQKIHQ